MLLYVLIYNAQSFEIRQIIAKECRCFQSVCNVFHIQMRIKPNCNLWFTKVEINCRRAK